MQDSPQHPTTSCLPKTDGRFLSGKQHPQWIESLEPGMVGRRFGMVEIVSTKLRKKHWTHFVEVRCTQCGKVKWINKDNLLRGKTAGCQSCSQKISKSSHSLGKRFHALRNRCNNPTCPGYKNYGARGVKCEFKSARDFILWVEKNLPHPDYRGVEIDRVDNNGNYAPGNLRLADKRMNNSNKQNTAYSTFKGEKIPSAFVYDVVRTVSPTTLYAPNTLRNLVAAGLTVEEIIYRYENLPSCKPKGCMTLPTPDQEIASQYLGASYTTANLRSDTAEE